MLNLAAVPPEWPAPRARGGGSLSLTPRGCFSPGSQPPAGCERPGRGLPLSTQGAPQCDSPSLWPRLDAGVLTSAAGRATQQSVLLTMVARQQGSSLEGGRRRRGAGGSPTERRRDDSHSEAQPLLARTSLHPWVSTTALGRAWGPGVSGARLGRQGTPELSLGS